MFNGKSGEGYRQALPGIRIKTLVHGDKTLMCEFLLDRGSVLPAHSHPHEQTGYLASGRITLIIDGVRYPAAAGDSWCIPGGTMHGAEAEEDSVAVEVFSPVREDYLPSRP